MQDDREKLYELNSEDSRMLATIGAFRVSRSRICAMPATHQYESPVIRTRSSAYATKI